MSEDTLLPFAFPPVQRKKVVAASDGGRLTSDGGVMLLAAAERRLGIVDKLATLIADPRDPNLVTHSLAGILRARILASPAAMRTAMTSITCAAIPVSNSPADAYRTAARICARQPTISRWENAPTRHEVAAMSYAMIDIYCAS